MVRGILKLSYLGLLLATLSLILPNGHVSSDVFGGAAPNLVKAQSPLGMISEINGEIEIIEEDANELDEVPKIFFSSLTLKDRFLRSESNKNVLVKSQKGSQLQLLDIPPPFLG